MDVTYYLLLSIVAAWSAGILGFLLGKRQGLLEGFIDGAMTFMTANDEFLAYNSKLVKFAVENDEDEDEDGETPPRMG